MKRYWELGGDGELTLTFPAPAEPVSVNDTKGRHWAAVSARTDPWRDLAHVVSRQGLAGYARAREVWPAQAITVQVDLPFRTRRRRDPHNYTGTVVKAVVDGLVRGGVIPDDTPEWATILEPTISIQPDKTRALVATVTIRPRSQ